MQDLETLLDPLTGLIRKHKAIEASVLWLRDGVWSDATGDPLETEEIVFYAEGLLMEGFSMAWDHVTLPGLGDHLRLCFWQGADPALPPLDPGMVRLGHGQIMP